MRRGAASDAARLEPGEGGRTRVLGVLNYDTVAVLLLAGSEGIAAGRTAVIDLAGVSASDSAGLALLIEWLSVARAAGHALRYEKVPPQLLQLARLSEVEDLLTAA
ncbi:MAG TPA: STAS domain-containing protein [Steroidobacteraceae bacterium]|nr:STAS domain-containing protein [Steroidobacteraceae bacterium]